MSVTLEKRRKVAELEDFERRIRQEKRRLLNELESLERPFRNGRSTSWIEGFSSGIAGGRRAVYDAASLRAPVWLYAVAGIVLLAGGGLVAHVALRAAPPERNEETAAETRAAQVAAVVPATTSPTSAARDSAAAPAPDVTALRERPLKARAVSAPLPEPLSPPVLKTETLAAAPAPEAAPVLRLDAARPKTAFDDAPPVDTADSASAAQSADESQREEKPANEGRRTQCLVKVDGRVLFERTCLLRQPTRSMVSLAAGDEAVVLTLERGRTWTASLGGRSLGKVYRTGQCWGRRREVYICAKGA